MSHQPAPHQRHRSPETLLGSRVVVEEAPAWTTRRKVKNTPRSDASPITMLLLDRQIHADQMTRYTRWVRRLETPQAVQEAGRIEMDFDPATQRLLIHGISIYRDGELTNYAKLEDLELIQREKDLEKGIYAGSLTALMLLKDIRTGDVIDLEMSIESDDAVFAEHYWFTESFEHVMPVGAQYFSWLAKETSRFQIENTFPELEFTSDEVDGNQRMSWVRFGACGIEPEPNMPAGYNPFKTVSITSFSSWKEVASEVADLWDNDADPGEDLISELEKLRNSYPADSQELIEALVIFVRDTIRYQGVEVGRLGLIPEPLSVIWERRFGDCKEKTSMLCWLLRECGFEATPALVSSELFGRISNYLPAPIFDHVVVHLRYQEKDYWIDPTNIAQRGGLESWSSLPFEKALLISHDAENFIDIEFNPNESDFFRVREHYDFSKGNTATITVSHEYNAAGADSVRNVLDSQGRIPVQQIFTEIVQSTRREAELIKDMEIVDDGALNRITLSGVFSAKDCLARSASGNSFVCELVPHSIIGKITGLDDKPRKHPLGLVFPANIEHVTELNHPDAQGAIVPKLSINNEMIQYEAGSRKEGDVNAVYYRYISRSPEVPVDKIGRYRENLKAIGPTVALFFETAQRGMAKPRQTGETNWLDAERTSSAPMHRGYDSSRGQSSRGGFPMWLIWVFVFILIKLLVIFSRG